MSTSPICLLQWLERGEYSETTAALATFAHKVNIEHAEVRTKLQAERFAREWFKNNDGNAQYCFVGSHGILDSTGVAIGIGASSSADEYAEWKEIWDWCADGHLIGGLWLGACKSSHAAAALSSVLGHALRPAIPYIYGFREEIYPYPEIEQILLKLIEFTDTDRIVSLPEELDLLRTAVPGTAIELYYPAALPGGRTEYVSVDLMPKEIGMTFPELLENQGRVGKRQ
jgi:hypothetical protein